MGSLYMAGNEHNQWIQYISEAAKLMGQECKLYEIAEKVQDINQDPKITYKDDPVDISIFFEDNPKPVLKKLGWYSEDENLPYVAYITNLSDKGELVTVEQYCKVEIPYTQVATDTSMFLVSEVRGSKINPLFWICKLVPYRYNVKLDAVDRDPRTESDDADMGFSYLRQGS